MFSCTFVTFDIISHVISYITIGYNLHVLPVKEAQDGYLMYLYMYLPSYHYR